MLKKDDCEGRWHSIMESTGIDKKYLVKRHGPCPICGGKDRFRFDDKNGKGTYFCNSCGSGNGFSLLMKFHNKEFPEVCRMIENVIGGCEKTSTKIPDNDQRKRYFMRRIWDESRKIIKGDPADKYLSGRSISLSAWPKCLRMHPSLDYFRDGLKVGSYAAMVAKVIGHSGQRAALHITYLDCPFPNRKNIGFEGSIRLFQNFGELAVAEGIETALSVNVLTNLPVWSCMSAGGMERLCIPKLTNLHIFSDNDHNFTGQKSAYLLAHRASMMGINVTVHVPNETDTDFNDVLRRSYETRIQQERT